MPVYFANENDSVQLLRNAWILFFSQDHLISKILFREFYDYRIFMQWWNLLDKLDWMVIKAQVQTIKPMQSEFLL